MKIRNKDDDGAPHGELTRSLFRFYGAALSNPGAATDAISQIAREIGKSLSGKSGVQPEKGDRRFQDSAWESNPFYRTAMQGHLAMRAGIEGWINALDLSPKDEGRASTATSSILDAVAPTNTLLGNPAALKRTIETGGENLVTGARQMLEDLQENGGMPSMVDKSKFTVGKNLALTPGNVVRRDPEYELIQYAAQTEKVHGTPILVVPPQINKYYVWDLAPKRSIIEFLVSSGFQVFIVSWFNPDAKQAEWGLDGYVAALERAVDTVSAISGSEQVHLAAACSGGITTAALLGAYAADSVDRVRSLTLMVTILDTDEIADTSMGLFANLDTLELAKAASGSQGVLEGRDLAKVFAWLRPNELIWSYWVNNYLMGESPPAFDLLYWNTDVTRMTSGLHGDFVGILESNGLARPGTVEIGGRSIDLSRVTCDAFVLGGETDHITPWEGCYRTTGLLGGKTDFVLTNSGHVQSIVSPPGNKKTAFYTGATGDSPETFKESAKQNEGSWWPYWVKWLEKRSGKKTEAPKQPGSKEYPPLDEAPGTYVRIEA